MSKNKNLCIVTGLFDIGRGNLESGFKRSFEHYIACFERLLTIEYPMIIYIEPQNEHIVWKHRKRENTTVIIKTLDYLKSFPFYDKVQEIRKTPEWYGQSGWIPDSTQAALELYNPLVMSKQFMLNDASLINPHSTKYFLWIDAGISNTIGDPKQFIDAEFETRISPLLNKMFFIGFPYDGQVEIHGFEKKSINRYAGKEVEFVCRGGMFGGNKDAINAFNDTYYHLLNDTLHSNKMGTEESIFSIFAHKHPERCNVRFIEGNGLIIKFLGDLKKELIEKEPEFPLAFYSLTYNTPKQFKMWIDSFMKAYPKEFTETKKYVIDNSTDEKAKEEYRKLFSEYNFEIIHEGTNIGIQDGRFFAAEHFGKTDHKYYVFFEEDMNLVSKDDFNNKNGFIRYVPQLFNKSIDIVEENNLDYLKLTIIEFYGDCTMDWSYKNVPTDRRDKYFPIREDGSEELRWKTKIEYLGFKKDLAFAVGHFHVDNWPILITKKGNYQMYLEDPYEHKYEATTMSQCKTYLVEGKLKGSCLLASPIEHNRILFYDGKSRKENKHYKN